MAREKIGPWASMAAVVFYPGSAALARRRYINRERIPQLGDGGAILVLNHISHIDPMFDAVFVHRQGRLPRFLAKHTLWDVPVFGKIMAGSGQVPVYRGGPEAASSLRDAEKALRDGGLVVYYPEGTITRDPDGWPMVARTGIARLALSIVDTDVPVIPAARWGTREILDGYAKKFRPFPRHDVITKLGEPIDLSAYRGKPVNAAVLREVTDLIMKRITELLADIRQQPAPSQAYQWRPSGKSGAKSDGGSGGQSSGSS